jgi:hypothetical protein
MPIFRSRLACKLGVIWLQEFLAMMQATRLRNLRDCSDLRRLHSAIEGASAGVIDHVGSPLWPTTLSSRCASHATFSSFGRTWPTPSAQ